MLHAPCPTAHVVVLGERSAGEQGEIVRGAVIPRFVEWCKLLGLRVMLGVAGRNDGSKRRILSVQLPVRARGGRVVVADQILADLRAAAAAAFPELLGAACGRPTTEPMEAASVRAECTPASRARWGPRDSGPSGRSRWCGTCPACGARIWTIRSGSTGVKCTSCQHVVTDDEEPYWCDVEMPIRDD